MNVTLEDPKTLQLMIDTCNADLVLKVTETADDVRIAVTGDEPDDPGDCADGRTVRLTKPLGDRTVTDANTGVYWELNAERVEG
jgi:hypothetical protein